MSIPLSGAVSRSAGLVSAIGKELKALRVNPVSKITVQFDPFEKRVDHARRILFYLSAPKLQSTNLSFILKSKVVCDRSPPLITCDLNFYNNGKCLQFLTEFLEFRRNEHHSLELPEPFTHHSGEKVIFKCANLDTLDILKLYNKHISSLAPKEEPVETGRPKKKKKLRVKIRIPRRRR